MARESVILLIIHDRGPTLRGRGGGGGGGGQGKKHCRFGEKS